MNIESVQKGEVILKGILAPFNFTDGISPSINELSFDQYSPNKKNESNLLTIIFKELGYFFYEFFVLATQVSDKVKKFVAKNSFCRPFFVGVELLCLGTNIQDKLAHAKHEGYSQIKTKIEVSGEAISDLTWGLLLPEKIIHIIQKLFKAEKTLSKTLSGIVALFVIEGLLIGSTKIVEFISNYIEKKFSKKRGQCIKAVDNRPLAK